MKNEYSRIDLLHIEISAYNRILNIINNNIDDDKEGILNKVMNEILIRVKESVEELSNILNIPKDREE